MTVMICEMCVAGYLVICRVYVMQFICDQVAIHSVLLLSHVLI